MPSVDTIRKAITAKIVYYGPGLCGKTTNLEYIHKRLAPDQKGRLTSLATQGERTLFFDLMPVKLGKVRGYDLTFQLYTVPGQVFYNASRKMVLKGLDGIVFVADSDPARAEANVESLRNLYENLRELHIDPDEVPLILQYNKRDLPVALSIEALQRDLNYDGVPAYRAVAVRGVGVLETLGAALRAVEEKIRQ